MTAKKDLGFGEDVDWERQLIEELVKYPCFGGCGKTWDESEGGWQEFEARDDGEPGSQSAAAWYCNDCFAVRTAWRDSVVGLKTSDECFD